MLAYTVGAKCIYEEALKGDPRPEKSPGGSVWRRLEDAQEYLRLINGKVTINGVPAEGAIYGLLLPTSWDADVEFLGAHDGFALKVPAKILTIEEVEGFKEATRIRGKYGASPEEKAKELPGDETKEIPRADEPPYHDRDQT